MKRAIAPLAASATLLAAPGAAEAKRKPQRRCDAEGVQLVMAAASWVVDHGGKTFPAEADLVPNYIKRISPNWNLAKKDVVTPAPGLGPYKCIDLKA